MIVGLAWPQHVAFLDDRRLCRQIRQSMRETVRSLADHPAVLLFSLGNEIPRPASSGGMAWREWRGSWASCTTRRKPRRPTPSLPASTFRPTEFLEPLPFDVCAFNVYLHGEANLRAYISRLQHLAGSRPLLLTEIGADSIREGEEGQAALMAMQLRAAFSGGAAGTVAFTWTDEWWRGGHTVEDWALGVVDAARRPKLAARAVVEVYGSVPFSPVERRSWPKVSVLVCAYNAASTLDDCLTSLMGLTYPQFEVIVVNDGSRDETSAIARRYPGVKVIDTPNRGLSAARNTALEAATGEIVAYTDSDVRVDPDWLTFLVQPFLRSGAAAVGGPNIVPRDDPWKAQCIARSPGGPTHVLLDDHVAEHVPGCNTCFRHEVGARHVMQQFGSKRPAGLIDPAVDLNVERGAGVRNDVSRGMVEEQHLAAVARDVRRVFPPAVTDGQFDGNRPAGLDDDDACLRFAANRAGAGRRSAGGRGGDDGKDRDYLC